MSDPARADNPITVVIADDEPAVADYLRLTLSLEDGEFEIVGIVHDAGSAVDLVREAEPDVLLLDLHMPGGGVEAAQLVSSLHPATRVLVFTADADGTELLPLLRSGISGYLTKGAESDEVVDAVRAVAAGRVSFAPDITAKAVGELTRRLHEERSAELRTTLVRRRIDRTIRRGEYSIVVQPVVDLTTGIACGVEALTRFAGPPERSPDRWFAEAGTVDRLIDLELATAASSLRALDVLSDDVWLSINLSPTTILSGEIDRLFAGTDLARVVLELTEHASVDDYGFLQLTLDRLRARGARVAVDDAGGGYASFAHVVKIRPDFIKLDRSLIAEIDVDLRKQALAEAFAGYAARVEVDVIAEGVETAAQLELLRQVGVRYGQGYHLGSPEPLPEREPARADIRPAGPIARSM